jgi:hypothetical protein
MICMSNQTINPMLIGQTQRVHVKAYAQDNANSPGPSQIVDTTTPLVVSTVFQGIASAAVDPNDNRAIVITALAAGNGQIAVNESPQLSSAGRLLLDFTVSAPPPDNRRIDLLVADAPI